MMIIERSVKDCENKVATWHNVASTPYRNWTRSYLKVDLTLDILVQTYIWSMLIPVQEKLFILYFQDLIITYD